VKSPTTFKHEFVTAIPERLAEETLYVSIDYATAAHKCACGCGAEIVTPISPTDWKLIFDGESVSLNPSVGNWSLPCQSHYWINNDRVRWAEVWTQDQIDAGRTQDRATKQMWFGPNATAKNPEHRAPSNGFLSKICKWFSL